MLLEKQLSEEYKEKAATLHSPIALKRHVANLYENYHQTTKKGLFKKLYFSTKLQKVAVFSLLFIMLTGFGIASTKYLFDLNSDIVRIEVSVDSQLKLQSVSGEQLRADLTNIKEQLAPGETALVYLADLENEKHHLFRDIAGAVITNPILIEDYDHALQLLQANFHTAKLPIIKSNEFHFLNAFPNYPQLTSGFDIQALKKLDELKLEAKRAGERVVWHKLETYTPIIPVVTLTYLNQQGEEVYVVLEKMDDIKTEMRITLGAEASYEKLNVNGSQAYYINNPEHIFSKSGQYQEIAWIVQNETETLIYHVASDSLNISKDDLLFLAKNIQ